jgi:hypothetical protein
MRLLVYLFLLIAPTYPAYAAGQAQTQGDQIAQAEATVETSDGRIRAIAVAIIEAEGDRQTHINNDSPYDDPFRRFPSTTTYDYTPRYGQQNYTAVNYDPTYFHEPVDVTHVQPNDYYDDGLGRWYNSWRYYANPAYWIQDREYSTSSRHYQDGRIVPVRDGDYLCYYDPITKTIYHPQTTRDDTTIRRKLVRRHIIEEADRSTLARYNYRSHEVRF